MVVEWLRCKGNIWCELTKIDANHQNLSGVKGVYIIWSGKEEKTYLRIGLGNIRDEILKNQKDIAIQAFLQYNVYITWCEIGFKKENVVAFLQEKLKPKFLDNQSKAKPTQVNLPW